MDGLTMAWPWIWLLLPLPWLVFRFAPPAATAGGAALQVPFFDRVPMATGGATVFRRRTGWLIIAWLLLLLAASRPQWVGEPVQLPMTGRDLLLAVDISKSMTEQDMVIGNQRVDRLTAVKVIVGEFIRQRRGDRVGLILFGSRAYLQAPLTFDRHTVETLLKESDIGIAGSQTAIGDAIGLAVKRLRERPAEERVLLLLTDGANTAGAIEPLKAAELAAGYGIRIYAVGVGADGLLISRFFGVQGTGSLDETTLKAIAEKTDGRYFRARSVEDLQEVYQLIDQLEPIDQDKETFRPVRELYQWPLAAVLLVILFLPGRDIFRFFKIQEHVQ